MCVVICINCGWHGEEAALIKIPIDGERIGEEDTIIELCPSCLLEAFIQEQ